MSYSDSDIMPSIAKYDEGSSKIYFNNLTKCVIMSSEVDMISNI